MSRTVQCVKLGREAEGLERQPYPGAIGQRIFDNVSKQAWADWLASDNPYAKQDVEMMAAGNDKILNLIAITGKVK